jgi:radical SAM PhpK family P-methyltransferase
LAPEDSLDIISESFSLAIACLGNRLHGAGLSFDFVKAFQHEKQRLQDLLLERSVKTVAIITTYYLSPYPIREIVGLIRKCDENIKIIVGGPYVLNNLDGELLTDEQDKLLHLIGADYYVRDSFGEEILVDLVRAIVAGEQIDRVANLDQRYRSTHQRVDTYDFAVNVVDWRLFAGRLSRVVNFRTAVSCPFQCSFCNFPFFAGQYKLAPLEWCEQQLRELVALGVTRLQFVDDTFNVPKQRFEALLRMLIENDFGFRWSSFFKCQYADHETVRLMAESGCEYVFLGIESGSQTILDNMNKRAKIKIYRECMDLFHAHDIMTMCSLIVGFPGETEETFAETFEFVEQTRPTFYQQRLWWYDVHAPIHGQTERFGLTGSGYQWQHATMNSDEAHDLADRLFLDIENSVHITENALPFFLLGRGMGRDAMLRFLTNYMHANRQQYREDGRCDQRYVKEMINALATDLITTPMADSVPGPPLRNRP